MYIQMRGKMKIQKNYRIDSQLLKKLEAYAQHTGKTQTQVLIEALKQYLHKSKNS